MIKLKFKNRSKEIEFFKMIPYLKLVEKAGIRYAELINDLDDEKEVLKNFNDVDDEKEVQKNFEDE